MKTLITLLLTLTATHTYADVIYKCEPRNDDGDRFGSTLVIGVDDGKLNVISDYLPSFSLRPSAGKYSIAMKPYADHRLVLVPNASMLDYQANAVIHLKDGVSDSDPVAFGCTRL